MSEFFVVANSNAAPFFSDTSEEFVRGEDAYDALASFVADYRHPSGLYAAQVYRDANAFHKRLGPLASWLSEKAQKSEKAQRVVSRRLPVE